jgi:hypothetical protein
MERAVLPSKGPSLRVPLGEIFTDSEPSPNHSGNTLEQTEREQIVRALRESNWVVEGCPSLGTVDMRFVTNLEPLTLG